MKRLLILAVTALLAAAGCKKDKHDQSAFAVVGDSSAVKWKGYLGNNYFNEGTFRVEGPQVQVTGRQISGAFTIPISSVNVTNLTGAPKGQLEEHLKSPDFFRLPEYPTAKFEIVKMVPLTPENGTAPNYTVTGNFIMIGAARSITFPALVQFENDRIRVKASFRINRLHWGMTYASDPAAGDEHYILPDVDIELKLLAKKK